MTKPYHEMSEQEKLAFGQEVAEDPTCHDMERQGQPLTNVEMDAAALWSREERRKAKRFIEEEL